MAQKQQMVPSRYNTYMRDGGNAAQCGRDLLQLVVPHFEDLEAGELGHRGRQVPDRVAHQAQLDL